MQRSNQSGRPAPTPIFNHKKRQRQAMFADPQSSDKPTCNTNYPDLMPVPGCNRRNEGNQNTSSVDHQLSRSVTGASNRFNFHGNANTGSMFNHQGQTRYTNQRVDIATSQQGSNHFESQQNSRGGFGNHQSSSTREAFQREWQPQRGSQNQLSAENMDNMFDSIMEDTFGGNSSPHWEESRNTASIKNNQCNQRKQNRIDSTNSRVCGPNRAPPGGRHKTSSTSSMNTWGGEPTQASPIAACPVPQPSSKFPQNNKNQYSVQQLPSKHFDSRTQQNMVQSSAKSTTRSDSQGSVQSKKAKIEDVDRSLKVLTLTTSGIKKWHQMNNQLSPVFFEVFGIIDSAILKDKTGSGKEFLLRDEEDKFQCVFYEIDRELPRLIRGQWHRCMGSLDSRTGYMKCVSVRPATKVERQMAKSVEKACEKTLMSLIRYSKEQ